MKAFGKLNNINNAISALEVPKPAINNDELLVKIKAIGVGVHDEYFHATDVSYPYVIGIEGAGVIEELGTNFDGYQKGQRIAFTSVMQPKGGTWAEYAVVSRESLIISIPSEMSFEQAAAVPVVGNTMLKIIHGAEVPSGGTLFVAGGAGAIGSLLIQVAKQRGITIIASASAKNHDFMKQLGADYTVDYNDHDWTEQVRKIVPNGVDAAIGIHPGTPAEILPVVKNGGTLIAVSGDNFPTERDVTLKGVFNDIDVRRELNEFIQQIVRGEIKQTIEKVYPFSESLQALEKVKTRHACGKIVISINN